MHKQSLRHGVKALSVTLRGGDKTVKNKSNPNELDDLRERFLWTREKLDGWFLLDDPEGTLKGDCDDFALTALWIMCGRSKIKMWWKVLTFRAVIWYCLSKRGNGHAVLWMKGHGWIDNMFPNWSKEFKHKNKVFPFTAPHMLMKMLVGKISKGVPKK